MVENRRKERTPSLLLPPRSLPLLPAHITFHCGGKQASRGFILLSPSLCPSFSSFIPPSLPPSLSPSLPSPLHAPEEFAVVSMLVHRGGPADQLHLAWLAIKGEVGATHERHLGTVARSHHHLRLVDLLVVRDLLGKSELAHALEDDGVGADPRLVFGNGAGGRKRGGWWGG